MIVPAEQQATSDRLRAHVAMLAGRIGERNYMRLAALDSAADYMHATLASLGYTVTEQRYTAGSKTFRNVEAVLPVALVRTRSSSSAGTMTRSSILRAPMTTPAAQPRRARTMSSSSTVASPLSRRS